MKSRPAAFREDAKRKDRDAGAFPAEGNGGVADRHGPIPSAAMPFTTGLGSPGGAFRFSSAPSPPFIARSVRRAASREKSLIDAGAGVALGASGGAGLRRGLSRHPGAAGRAVRNFAWRHRRAGPTPPPRGWRASR